MNKKTEIKWSYLEYDADLTQVGVTNRYLDAINENIISIGQLLETFKPTRTTEYVEKSKKNQHSWEEEFDKEFETSYIDASGTELIEFFDEIKQFIRSHFVEK